MSHLAFLGYNSNDRPIVEAVAGALKAHGIHYWVDFEKIGGGDRIPTEIWKAMGDATAIVEFLGREMGKWQDAEIGEAQMISVGGDKPIIAVMINGAGPPVGLTRFHAIQLRDAGDSDAIKELAEAILRTDVAPTETPAGKPSTAASSAYDSFRDNFIKIVRTRVVNMIIGPELWSTAGAWTEVARKLLVERAQIDGAGAWFQPSSMAPPVELSALLFALQQLDDGLANVGLNEVLQSLESEKSLFLATQLVTASQKMRNAAPSKERSLPRVLLTTIQGVAIETAMLIGKISFTRVVQDVNHARIVVEEYDYSHGQYSKGKAAQFDPPRTEPEARRLLAETAGREHWYCSEADVPDGEDFNGLIGSIDSRGRPNMDFRNRPNPVLYKFKGSLDLEGSCILSTDQILECVWLSRANGLVPAPIVTSLTQTTPLFLGYYLCDMDLRLLRKTVLRNLPPGRTPLKFALSPEPAPGPTNEPWGQDEIRSRMGGTLHQRLVSDGYEVIFSDVNKFLDDLIRRL